MQDTAFSEAPGRCSASEQPEALSQAIPKKQLFMTSSVCSTQPSLTSTQQQALSAIDARLHLLGDYAVEAFKCQLWEPSRAVQELEPGISHVYNCQSCHHWAHAKPVYTAPYTNKRNQGVRIIA